MVHIDEGLGNLAVQAVLGRTSASAKGIHINVRLRIKNEAEATQLPGDVAIAKARKPAHQALTIKG
ncbi:MAG: hypothetical protein NTY67_06480 [Cyanobacteria bacterium]|nr:hypothetical protein [Cyanobacteriota bacterium]